MRPAVYAILLVVIALVLLGAATSTWTTVLVEGPMVDGVQVPPDVRETAGATASPASLPASLVALVSAGMFATIGPALRRSVRLARGLHLAAALVGLGAVGLGIAAVLNIQAVEIVTLGEADVQMTGTSARRVYLLGIVCLTILLGLSLHHRGGWRGRTDAPSRYTVEAVRGEVPAGPDDDSADTSPADDPAQDEWDLAVVEDPAAEDDS